MNYLILKSQNLMHKNILSWEYILDFNRYTKEKLISFCKESYFLLNTDNKWWRYEGSKNNWDFVRKNWSKKE